MQEQNEDLSFVSFPLHSLYAHCTALAMTLESHGWEKSLRLGLGAGERRKVSKISMDSNGNSIKLSSLGMGQLPGLLCPAILTQGAAWNGEGMETAFDRSRRAVRDTWRRDLRGERACRSFCMSSSDSATVPPVRTPAEYWSCGAIARASALLSSGRWGRGLQGQRATAR